MKARQTEEANFFRIKELIEKTGISRETIHFYLLEGLLPEPKKTSKNMSWYSHEHVERLNIIKELQEKQFLPLKAIKAILNNAEEHNFTDEQQILIAEIKNKLIHTSTPEKEDVNINQIVTKNMLNMSELKDMTDIKFINVKTEKGKKTLSLEDKELVEDWVKLRELGINKERGFSPKDLDVFADIAEIIFNHEFSLFTEKLSDLSGTEAIEIIDKAVPVVNHIISVLHQRKIREFITNFNSQDKNNS